MNHLRAIELLPQRSTLGPDQVRALEAHAAECADCRDWLETWELFTDLPDDAETHLDSKELCAYALGVGDPSPADLERCRWHLASCSACSAEVILVRESVGRVDEPVAPAAVGAESRRRPAAANGVWLALAATVALLVGGMIVAGGFLELPSVRNWLAGPVSGIESSESILIAGTQVGDGSVLNLRGTVVAFGDGFSVDSGGVLIVGAANDVQ